MLRAQLQPAASTSAAALTMSAERQERRRRRQFAHDWQPPPWMRTTFTAVMDMDLDEETAAAPRQLPSGMVLHARVRHVGAADPTTSVVMHDHVDLAAASPGASPNPARGAWELLASRRLPRDLRALGWRILHITLFSGVFLARVNPRRAAAYVCCSSPVCCAADTYETMQHLFLECPNVAALSYWLVRLWMAVSPPGSTARRAPWRCCLPMMTACGSLTAVRSTAGCGPSSGSASCKPCGASDASLPLPQSSTPSPQQLSWPPPSRPSSDSCGSTTRGRSAMRAQ